MRKHYILVAICCLLSIYSCQKESIAPLPELNTARIETVNKSDYFKINTLEDLATFEELYVQKDRATSRSAGSRVVHVPSNSKNAIQAAINEVGHYGVVYLEKGRHYEEQTILITHPVFVVGREGATIIASSQINDEFGPPAEPIFSIRQTTRVTIWGVEMQGRAEGSNMGIEILNSTRTVVSKNTINNFQTAIAINGGDNTLAWKNNITGVRAEDIQISVGIVVIDGVNVRILQNKISGYIWGIICGSQDGLIQSNELFGNSVGLNLDFVVPVVVTSEGNLTGSKVSATNWTVQNNYAHHNQVGYVLSFGANNNKLINNRGGNNSALDLFLDTDGFNALGVPSPASFDNFVDNENNKDFSIQDCGNNNRVVGGRWIPCN